MVIIVIYLVLGYWAVGKTVYANYVMIGTFNAIFCKKLAAALLFGWALIPIAIIKSLLGH